MANPVRIYVLHHPKSQVAADLTNRIYEWFRLPSLEGIPVYVRSYPAKDSDRPLPPHSGGTDPNELEYLVPLVDAHMVRDPAWHDYLVDLANKCQPHHAESFGWVMFPVGLDSTAFNLPKIITRRNYIRHGAGQKSADPSVPAPDDTEETLKHLTEAMAHDLNGRLFPKQANQRFKIFISYSRADSTAIARTLRDYIQGETQCQVFLDQNDIAFGSAFDKSLKENVEDHARALIVINGDSYASRPWCRWEIRRFTEPRKLPLDPDASGGRRTTRNIHLFHPLLVVDDIKGPEITRVVPELSQAPVVRWEAGREKRCFSILMREVLLGLKDVLVARQVLAKDPLKSAVVVNRLPGPIAIERLVGKNGKNGRIKTIHHPGNGLPLIELRLLKQTFEKIQFRAFRDILSGISEGAGGQGKKFLENLNALEKLPEATLPLRRKTIALSTSFSPEELAIRGYLPQHQHEALIHLFRPLVRMGADILFGGFPPKLDESYSKAAWSADTSITTSLVRLLADERREDEVNMEAESASRDGRGSLIFNVPGWPKNLKINENDEAAWINTCRILRVNPEDAGLPPWTGPTESDEPGPGMQRYMALTVCELRKRLGTGFKCRLPGDGELTILPAAFIFAGGRMKEFTGLVPGVMEEFLRAVQASPRRPIYLIGGLAGAAGVIADALVADPAAVRPELLTFAFYHNLAERGGLPQYKTLLEELQEGDLHPSVVLDELWDLIEKHRVRPLDDLFHNGLSDAQNRQLLTTTNTYEAVGLIWEGISNAPGLMA